MKGYGIGLVLFLLLFQVDSFVSVNDQSDFGFRLSAFRGSPSKSIPREQQQQAISAVKAAINKPKTPNFGLIECEFPPLASLNKLGDGSLRSSQEVDDSNLAFSQTLRDGIAPIAFLGPKIWILTSSMASANFVSKAKKIGGVSHSFRDGIPKTDISDICLLVSPSSRTDYDAAQKLTSTCKAVVIVNGLAKDTSSVSYRATMAYYRKPLTYNSQIIGYLTRVYPQPWRVTDVASNRILASFEDNQILVKGTNTPDLREPCRLVQKAVDELAIKARKNR
jgi:Domain of unknown function (DUF1995)